MKIFGQRYRAEELGDMPVGESAGSLDAELSKLVDEAAADFRAETFGDEEQKPEPAPEPEQVEQPETETAETTVAESDETPTAESDVESSVAAETADEGGVDERQEILSLAEQYGVTPAYAESFTDVEAFKQWLEVADQNAIHSFRRQQAQAATAPEVPKPEVSQPAPEPTTPAPEVDPEYQQIVERLKAEDFDESLVQVVEFTGKQNKSLRQLTADLQKQVETLTQTFQEREQSNLQRQRAEQDALIARRVQTFDENLSSLEHTELFGKAGTRTPEQEQNRAAVIDAANAIQASMAQRGVQTNAEDKQIVERAVRGLFSRQVMQKEQTKQASKLKSQAAQTMGTGRTTKADPAKTEFTGDVSTDPVMQQLIKSANGSGLFD